MSNEKAKKIRKATRSAIAQRDAYVNETTADIAAMYRKAADDMAAQVRGDDGRRVEPLELHALLFSVSAVLNRLGALRDARLENDLNTLSVMAGMPFSDALSFSRRERARDAAVSFVKNFVHSDGLQLSDRLWRLNRHAADAVGEHLKAAVGNGDDAFHAVMGSMGSGADVPPHIAKAYDASRAGALRQSLREVMTGSPDPATGGGVVYQAERLFRTELIRAHGEAYMNMAFETEGAACALCCRQATRATTSATPTLRPICTGWGRGCIPPVKAARGRRIRTRLVMWWRCLMMRFENKAV